MEDIENNLPPKRLNAFKHLTKIEWVLFVFGNLIFYPLTLFYLFDIFQSLRKGISSSIGLLDIIIIILPFWMVMRIQSNGLQRGLNKIPENLRTATHYKQLEVIQSFVMFSNKTVKLFTAFWLVTTALIITGLLIVTFLPEILALLNYFLKFL